MKKFWMLVVCAMVFAACGGDDDSADAPEDEVPFDISDSDDDESAADDDEATDDGDIDRPTVEQLCVPLECGGGSGDYQRCVAELYLDSDISDEGLQILADPDLTDEQLLGTLPESDLETVLQIEESAYDECQPTGG